MHFLLFCDASYIKKHLNVHHCISSCLKVTPIRYITNHVAATCTSVLQKMNNFFAVFYYTWLFLELLLLLKKKWQNNPKVCIILFLLINN